MEPVSRREFFGRLAAAVCVGVAAPKLAPAVAEAAPLPVVTTGFIQATSSLAYPMAFQWSQDGWTSVYTDNNTNPRYLAQYDLSRAEWQQR